MNFLAHLLLAQRTGTSLAGAILGDVVRGADLSDYPDDIALGVRLHRRIDAATDRHPALQPLRESFSPGARRYAGIVLDLACDHALTRHWALHSAVPLSEFCAHAGQAMADAAQWFDHAGGRAPTADGFSDLLLSYGRPQGIDRAIARTASRLRQPQPLIDAAQSWPVLLPTLDTVLDRVLNDLQQEMHALITAPSLRAQ